MSADLQPNSCLSEAFVLECGIKFTVTSGQILNVKSLSSYKLGFTLISRSEPLPREDLSRPVAKQNICPYPQKVGQKIPKRQSIYPRFLMAVQMFQTFICNSMFYRAYVLCTSILFQSSTGLKCLPLAVNQPAINNQPIYVFIYLQPSV